MSDPVYQLEKRLAYLRGLVPSIESTTKLAAFDVARAEIDGHEVTEARAHYAAQLRVLRFLRRELRDAEFELDGAVAAGSLNAIKELNTKWNVPAHRPRKSVAA